VKQESSCVSLKQNHHRAQKYLSEALEQLPSSKNLSEAQRAILTNHDNVWLSQANVFRGDDCDKLKSKQSKDSYNTRCSKQNSYHVTNKNIVSSRIPMVVRRKRGCLPGHPQA
jgi:hypothetical protein